MNIAIENGRLIDPKNRIDALLDLFIADGRVAGIGTPPPDFLVERRIEARGLVVCPGLIDLAARPVRLESELRAAVAGGITTLVCPPDFDQPLDEVERVERLVRQAEDLHLARLLPLGALTRGLAGERLAEMLSLARAGCIAFSQGKRPLPDNQALLRAFEYAATFDLPLWLQAQDPHLARHGFAHDGEVASRLGLTGIPVSAETVAIATCLILAADTGARLHLRHISSAAGMAMIEKARADGVAVTCDVGIHHLLLSEHDIGFFDAMARFDPPLRSGTDREFLGQGVARGTAVLCSDHTPLAADAKLLPFGEAAPGATGLELLLPLTLKWAAAADVPLASALARLTADPAAILGRSDIGHLAPGARADVCLFDPALDWPLTPESLLSFGKNTPLMGALLPARPLATLEAGRLVFDRLADTP
jgi:dihydroorotase